MSTGKMEDELKGRAGESNGQTDKEEEADEWQEVDQVSSDWSVRGVTPELNTVQESTQGRSQGSTRYDSDDGTDGQSDLFPETADPIREQDDMAPDIDVKHGPPPIDPARIALPPSPTQKPFIPHRAPNSWIPGASTPTTQDGQTHPTDAPGRRIASARLPSAASPLTFGGRTVSGAMQYAIQPSTTLQENDNDHGEGSHNVTAGDQLATADALDNARITDQDQDEVWMAFVRHQLGALFPDFFHDRDGQDGQQGQGGQAGQAGRDGLGGMGMNRTTSDDASRTFPTQTHSLGLRVSSPGVGMGGMDGVPDVRGELRGLKDEIDLLRGMVGGIAAGRLPATATTGGMHSPTPPDGAIPLDPIDSVDSDIHHGGAGGQSDHQGQEAVYTLPEAFYKTAHISYNLIRALDQALHRQREANNQPSTHSPLHPRNDLGCPSSAGKAEEEEDADADADDGKEERLDAVRYRTDLEIFDEQALYDLGNGLLQLFVSA